MSQVSIPIGLQRAVDSMLTDFLLERELIQKASQLKKHFLGTLILIFLQDEGFFDQPETQTSPRLGRTGNGKKAKIIYPWLVFNEEVKVNSVFLGDSVLMLFGGNICRGGLVGHLMILGCYLEFFMKADMVFTYITLKKDLQVIILNKVTEVAITQVPAPNAANSSQARQPFIQNEAAEKVSSEQSSSSIECSLSKSRWRRKSPSKCWSG